MYTAQIDIATGKVFATCTPPTKTAPDPGTLHVTVDPKVNGDVLGKTYNPATGQFS